MARNSRYRGAGKRRRNSGTYGKAVSESISVLRLNAADFPAVPGNLTTFSPAFIEGLISINRSHTFRLIAVGFASVDNTSGQPTTLEFNYGGSSFQLAPNATKPVRIRVPEKNYVAGQWWNVAVSGTTKTITPTLGAGSDSGALFNFKIDQDGNNTQGAAVQFIDVAIRY